MKKTQFRGVFMLTLTAFIWGSSFVAQSVGMESVEAFTFNGIRTLMGAAVLIPYILIRDLLKNRKTPQNNEKTKAENIKILKYGAILGTVLCIASNFQQFAFAYPGASSGKIAFITAFYMFFVPLIGFIFRKKVPLITWCSVLLGTVGLYFLCVGDGGFSAITKSDILAFICSVFFAVHILLVEKFAPDVDPIKLSCVQFFISGTISCLMMFIFESPDINAISSCMTSLLYSGVMSCGLAYTFQIVGQQYTESTVASLILCLESVFGVLCGAVMLHEVLTGREIAGCIIMFIAIIISQTGDIITKKIRSKAD